MNAVLEYFSEGFATPRDIVAQIIGLIPLTLSLFIFVQTTRKKTLVVKGISDLLWTVHYFVLGEFVGGGATLVSATRSVVFYHNDKKWARSPIVPVIFCAFTILCSFLDFQGIKSLMPTIGSVIAIIGFWQKDMRFLRIANLIGTSLWLIYGIMSVSIPTILCNIFTLISLITGILRKPASTDTKESKE